MSERPLIEEAMKRLAAQSSTRSRSDPPLQTAAASPAPVTGRQGIGRRSYDEALAWRRAQLAVAMGERPAPVRPLPLRSASARINPAEGPVLGRRQHELEVLHPAGRFGVSGGFSRAELIGTGLVCAVASAALTWALVLQSAGPAVVRSERPEAVVRPVPGMRALDTRVAGKGPVGTPPPIAVAEAAVATPVAAPIPAPVTLTPTPVATVRVPAEPAGPLSPLPVAGFEEAAVRAVLEEWRVAWSAVDLDRYLAQYAADFVSEDGLSRAAWAESRRKNFARKSGIAVELRQIELDRLADHRFAVHFIQDYRAGHYRENGTKKTLVMTRQADGWRISEERQGR